MSLKPRLSLRALLAIIAVCGASAWLARWCLYSNRMQGQHFALIGPMDIDRLDPFIDAPYTPIEVHHDPNPIPDRPRARTGQLLVGD
jgi:hypothetical protein